MYNVFPFNNSITKMQLSGTEVQELFDFVAGSIAGRGCVSQAQIAGARVILNCTGCSRGGSNEPVRPTTIASAACRVAASTATATLAYRARRARASSARAPNRSTSGTCRMRLEQLELLVHAGRRLPDNLEGQCDTSVSAGGPARASHPMVLTNVYDFATSNYLAAGGSGFKVLEDNTTQLNTHIEQRDALIDFIRNAPPCGYSTSYGTSQGLMACATDADCQSAQGPGTDFICACPGQVTATGTDTAETCVTSGSCDPSVGMCVRQDCRDDVATFHETACQGSPNDDQCNTDLGRLLAGRRRVQDPLLCRREPRGPHRQPRPDGGPMNAAALSLAALGALVVLGPGCQGYFPTIGEGKRLVVNVTSSEIRPPDQPLPISVFQPTTFTVDVTAQLPDGTTDTSFNGYVNILSQPGTVSNLDVTNIQLQNGIYQGLEVPVVAAFGQTHIWADDLGMCPPIPIAARRPSARTESTTTITASSTTRPIRVATPRWTTPRTWARTRAARARRFSSTCPASRSCAATTLRTSRTGTRRCSRTPRSTSTPAGAGARRTPSTRSSSA